MFDSSPEARDKDSSAATHSKIISQAQPESAFPLPDLKTVAASVQQDVSTATAPISNYSQHTPGGDTPNHRSVESPSPTFPGRPPVHSFLDDNLSKPKFYAVRSKQLAQRRLQTKPDLEENSPLPQASALPTLCAKSVSFCDDPVSSLPDSPTETVAEINTMSRYAHEVDWRDPDSEVYTEKVTLDEMTGLFAKEEQYAIPHTKLNNVERNVKVKQEAPNISHRRKYPPLESRTVVTQSVTKEDFLPRQHGNTPTRRVDDIVFSEPKPDLQDITQVSPVASPAAHSFSSLGNVQTTVATTLEVKFETIAPIVTVDVLNKAFSVFDQSDIAVSQVSSPTAVGTFIQNTPKRVPPQNPSPWYITFASCVVPFLSLLFTTLVFLLQVTRSRFYDLDLHDSPREGNFRQRSIHSAQGVIHKTVPADNRMNPALYQSEKPGLFTSRAHIIATLTKNKIPLEPLPNSTSVLGNICGRQLTFLIDTGASVTAIKASIFHQIPEDFRLDLSQAPIDCLRAVSGATMPVIGSTHIPFEIASEKYPFQALVIESLTYDVILGRDFLEFYNAKIDLEDHKLFLNNNPLAPNSPVQTAEPEEEKNVCFIHAQSSFIVPPNSEVLVPGDLALPYSENDLGLVVPRAELTERYQIAGASELVKVSSTNSVPIRLLNPTTQPVRIYRRTRLGQFSLVPSDIATFELLQAEQEAEKEREVPTAVDTDPSSPLDINSEGLTDDQQDRLRALLAEYDDIFAYSPDQLGRSSVVKHTIDTGDNPPIRLRSYRTTPANKEEIEKQVNEMLANDVIAPSVSAWAAPVVLVKKSDGTMRFCVDYRRLNAVTKKDSHPLPRISEALDALGGARWFSTLDLRSGYWQIEMAADSKEKTAFITHNGLYEFNVLPFGLCNSPATFQRLMTHVLRGLEWDICLVYIDDLIIFSRNFEDHLKHLEEVFKRLREANVRLKPSKCHFVKPQVEYLGHVVSAEGLKPNPDKIRAVKEFPIPTNTTGVKAFLGLCNYYRRFIKGFAQIASPLNKLTSKHIKFKWDVDCQIAFDTLKSALVSAPILAYPDFNLPFHLYVDASQTGIGLTLGQIVNGKEVAIAFAGRDLNKAERNYSATEREALAVIDGIKRFQPYLRAKKFVIHTDHNALKWLMSIQDPSNRIARWTLLIQQFDFDIVHRPGTTNGNADALSRRLYGTCSLNALEHVGVKTKEIYDFQRRDSDLADIIDYLENDQLPHDSVRAKRVLLSQDIYFLDENSLLYHLDMTQKRARKGCHAQLVLPPPLRYEVLVHAHDDLSGGHLGTFKTYEKLRDRFYWKGMYKDVEHWVRSCQDCATRKNPRNKYHAPLLPIPVDAAFSRLAVDVLGPLPITWSGNRYIVVFTEYLTKWPEIFPVKNADAVTIARLLTSEIIPRHGAPRTLLSDRGKNFLSTLVLEVCKLYSIKKLNTSSYHPQTDGLVERMNSTLCQTLSMFVSKHQKDWDVFIPAALTAFRTSPSESTGESPFYLLYGREPTLAMDTSLLPPADPASSIAEHRRRIVTQIELAQRIAKENIMRAQQKMKTFYDRQARDPTFIEGQKVWVFTPKTYKGLSKKLLHNYHGPYRVVEKLSLVHYRLRTCGNKPVSTIVHANRMKHFVDPNDRPITPPEDIVESEPFLHPDDLPADSFAPPEVPFPRENPAQGEGSLHENQSQPQTTDPDTNSASLIDDETIFNAEQILESRMRGGQTQYLVKWAKYPISEATWEPETNILDNRLIEDFQSRQRDS